MHFLAKRGTDLGALHEASYLQKTEFAHSYLIYPCRAARKFAPCSTGAIPRRYRADKKRWYRRSPNIPVATYCRSRAGGNP